MTLVYFIIFLLNILFLMLGRNQDLGVILAAVDHPTVRIVVQVVQAVLAVQGHLHHLQKRGHQNRDRHQFRAA